MLTHTKPIRWPLDCGCERAIGERRVSDVGRCLIGASQAVTIRRDSRAFHRVNKLSWPGKERQNGDPRANHGNKLHGI